MTPKTKQSEPTAITTAITPPKGARIHTLRVKVKLDRSWKEAIDAIDSSMPSNDSVLTVGDQYPPTGSDEIEEELIMLNYKKEYTLDAWDQALAWAESQGLKKTLPREVFAIGEQHPTLNKELKSTPMSAVATTECIFEGNPVACYVWWARASLPRAYLDWVGHFNIPQSWFVFRK